MLFFEFFLICFLGLVLGSFSTAMIYRIPRDIPWAVLYKSRADRKDSALCRSACPQCDHILGVRDLVPLFSWLFSRGKCRHCQAPISVVYPVTEFLVLAACLTIYTQFGFSYQGWMLMALTPFLTALLMIDLEYMILPNQLVAIIAGLGAVYLGTEIFVFHQRTVGDVLADNILGAAVFAGVIWLMGWFVGKVLKKDALGFGDVKFFGAAGLWLGFYQLPLFCVVSGVLGVALAIIWQVIKKTKVFPFGPALIIAFFILLVLDGSFLF